MAGKRDQVSLALALATALALAGCASGQVVDSVPESLGGLPAGAPARPVTPYQYPAVHDMPPARATQPMTEEEVYNTEKELRAVRDRQEAVAGETEPLDVTKKPEPPKTSQKTGAKTGSKSGAKTGAKTNP